MQLSFKRAEIYLKARYQQLRRPYSVAAVCYALAVSNQGCSKSVLLKSASPSILSHAWLHTDVLSITHNELYLNIFFVSPLISDHTHWLDADNPFITLEATGYTLLALLKGGHVQEAAVPFKWLNQQ